MRAWTRRFSKRQDDYPMPDGKPGQMDCGCTDGVDPKECPYFHRLQWDLANSYYWSGVCLKDYVFFVMNWHPLLGMFFCHPNHPWSKYERVLMFLASLAVTVVPSAAITRWSPEHRTFWTVTTVTIPDTISGVILYQLSIAETRGCCHICSGCIAVLTQFAILYVLVMGATSTFFCYMILNGQGEDHWLRMMQPLFVGKLYSYLAWFPLMMFMPCYIGFWSLWCYEKGVAEQSLSEGAPHGGHSASPLPSFNPPPSFQPPQDQEAASESASSSEDSAQHHCTLQ